MSDCRWFISNLVQEKIYCSFLPECRCPHQRRKAPFVLYVEQYTVCKNKAEPQLKEGEIQHLVHRRTVWPPHLYLGGQQLLRPRLGLLTGVWTVLMEEFTPSYMLKFHIFMYDTMWSTTLPSGHSLKTYSLLTLGAKSLRCHAACWSDWWSVWTNSLYPCLCSLETLALWQGPESRQNKKKNSLVKWVTLHTIV